MLRFGISAPQPDGDDDAAHLDALVARGHSAHEVSFTQGFPWKEKRCRAFGAAAAERGISLSIHAPYFAVLTSEEPDKARLTRSALEHTMKLAAAMGAPVVVAHTGYVRDRTPEELHRLVDRSLEILEPKIRHLGVALGLEVGGSARAFGTLGDIALIAERFPFVHPVVDWAHVHAMSNGALTTVEAFSEVLSFVRGNFAAWAVDPLHCQFTDNQFGSSGEIRHVPYGEGTLRAGPMVAAALAAGMRLTVISEAREDSSHDAIQAEIEATLRQARNLPSSEERSLDSGRLHLPEVPRIRVDGDAWVTVDTRRPVRLSNVDKPFFPDGYTKGDLIAYYAAIAPVLLPHLRGRPIVLTRYPDGADGNWFFEKQAPPHTPEWVETVPLWSAQRGADIDFVTAPDVESLLWIANSGAIELHPWLSRAETADRPDFAVFDLDPAQGAGWEQVAACAELVRVALDRLGLESHPKTSGASGLHVYVPLQPRHDYRRVRRFVETVGRMVATADPDLATVEWDSAARQGRVFVDYAQNVAGKTIASVYSVRPRRDAPVSTPLLWDEVAAADPAAHTMATVWERLRRHGDLFAPVLRGGQTLDAAERVLGLAQ